MRMPSYLTSKNLKLMGYRRHIPVKHGHKQLLRWQGCLKVTAGNDVV